MRLLASNGRRRNVRVLRSYKGITTSRSGNLGSSPSLSVSPQKGRGLSGE
jgi:hypothetical protein